PPKHITIWGAHLRAWNGIGNLSLPIAEPSRSNPTSFRPIATSVDRSPSSTSTRRRSSIIARRLRSNPTWRLPTPALAIRWRRSAPARGALAPLCGALGIHPRRARPAPQPRIRLGDARPAGGGAAVVREGGRAGAAPRRSLSRARRGETVRPRRPASLGDGGT